MKDNQSGGYKVGKYTIECDLTELMSDLLGIQSKQKEKYILHLLLLRLSRHLIELAKVLSQGSPELARQIPRFFQGRVEDYRAALRVGKLVGFLYMAQIEAEATRRAWEDTETMIRKLSLLEDASLKGLVSDYRKILRRLSQAIVDLVLEQEDARLNLDLEGVRKFLEGEKI